MKVLLFTPNFLPSLGGAERIADVLVRRLGARGHEVRVLCQWSEGQKREIDLPYRVHRYRRPPKLNWWPELLTRPLRRVHRAWPFDVVLAFYAYPTGYAATHLKDKLGYKVVITPRGGDLYPSYHGLNKLRVRKTIAQGYRDADRIVSISGWLTGRIVEETGRPLDELPPIDAVPNGLDLDAFDSELAAAESRATPVIDKPFLLQLARLHPVKQQHIAIEAVAKLREAFQEHGMRYAVVGEGQARAELVKQIKAHGLGDTVQLLGKRTGVEKAWLLRHAQGFVTASREEGLPNVVLEAMAAGLPIIASDIGPHRELIEGQGWGWLFQTGDADDLAAKLQQLITAHPSPLRDAALKLREQYTLDRMIDGYETALQAAVFAADERK
jgi:glycosyltransferase involved in cell wall biosynthesis